MTIPMTELPKTFADAIDVVEQAYEFMLAYAGQGRRPQDEDRGAGVRDHLRRAAAGLDVIAAATPETVGVPIRDPAAAAYLDLIREDARRAAVTVRFVMAQPAIGSQIIINLNASSHVRALLADLYIFDEALKVSGI